jgi:hypothetical protein
MLGQFNQKIVGSFLVGIALVAGAFTYSRLGLTPLPQPASIGSTVPARIPIEITDKDQNGIEDWRDTFVTTEAVITSVATSSYELPTTVTGQLSIQFLENYIRSKYNGPFAGTKEEVIEGTVDSLTEQTAQKLLGTSDVTIMDTYTEADIKNYANAMANAILKNNVSGTANELDILNDILSNKRNDRIEELRTISNIYKNTMEDSLNTPVPALFLKEHLDLINSYSAIHQDIEGMILSVSDPMVALVRIKRYQDDALGLKLSGENMYTALQPYTALFTENDSAVFFANFSSANQRI